MKKIIIVLTQIAVVLILLSILTGLFMPKYVHENQDGRITSEFYREKLDTDVIFVGSSVTYSGISPATIWKDYGVTSYVRGNASQTTWQSYYMTEDAIKWHKPKLVVFDVGFLRNGDDVAEEPSNRKTLEKMRWSKSKWDCINVSMAQDEEMIDYFLPILRYHSRWNDLSWDDIKYLFFTGTVTHNGQIIDMRQTTEEIPDKIEYLSERSDEISEKNREYLIKLIELCKTNEIELMLMRVPRYTANWTEANDETIKKLSEEYGITYINFDDKAEEIGIDYHAMSNDAGVHLNTIGAETFSKYLGNYLINHYDIPRHDDEKYTKVWSEKLNKYEEDKANWRDPDDI